MTTDEPMYGMIRRCYCTPHPCSCEHPDGNEYPDPLGTSPLEHVKREITRTANDAALARFRPTGLRPDARIVAVPNVADPTAGPTPAELAAATPLDAFVDDLALATDSTPDHVLDAVRPILTGRATYRGAFIAPPLRGTGMPLRLRGVPYRAHARTDDAPGYQLEPDRHQRHQDHTAGPVARPRPPRFLTRTRLAPGCHPAFMVWCITAAGDLR